MTQENTEDDSIIFEASVGTSKIQEFLNPISVLVDECKIEVSEDGLQIRAVDPANVCMVDVTLSEDGFDSFEGQRSIIGVDLERLQSIISMGSSGSDVTLRADTSTQMLNVDVETVDYNLSLIDPDSIRDGPDIPDIKLPASTKIDGGKISQGIKAAGMVSDQLTLGFDDDKDTFKIGAEGDTDDVKVEHHKSNVESMSASNSETVYSLEYLKKISKAVGSGREVNLKLDDEKPVKITYDISEGDGRVIYMLAPRIQS